MNGVNRLGNLRTYRADATWSVNSAQVPAEVSIVEASKIVGVLVADQHPGAEETTHLGETYLKRRS